MKIEKVLAAIMAPAAAVIVVATGCGGGLTVAKSNVKKEEIIECSEHLILLF